MTESVKIGNLKDYFAVLRQRPGMYLGTNTISKLHDHLQGYMMSNWFNNIDNPIDKSFFDNFNDFVYRHYGVRTNDNWKGVILDQCFGNEQNALETFFELYDKFIDNVKLTDTKQIVIDLFDKLVLLQDEMKIKFGENYQSLLTDTVELFKENVFSNLKYDYETIYDDLKEKAETNLELRQILEELEAEHTK
jgi:hypothetical protein